MKSVKISKYFEVINPEYVYLRIKPNNSIRNNETHKIARAIASLYKNVTEAIKKEEAKLIRVLGREFLIGTKYSLQINGKVAYYVYMERKKVEFYFVIPSHFLSIIKERISDTWKNITLEQVDSIPSFTKKATKYQLVYEKEDALSLVVNRADNDLLRSNLNVLDVMQDGDKVGIFYNFMPTSQFSWAAKYKATIAKLKNGKPIDRNKFNTNYALKLVFSLISSIIDDIASLLGDESTKKKKEDNVNVFEALIQRMNGGKQITDATDKKANDKILDTQIVVMSESNDELRQRNNARSAAQSFDVITGDNRLVFKRYKGEFVPLDYRLKGVEVNKMSSLECSNFIAAPGRDLLEQYNVIDKVETSEAEVPEDLRNGYMRIGTSTYRGNKQEAYLSTDREYKTLMLALIGPTRAGKSTLIGNLAYDAIKAGECVIIFDYIGNCELSNEVAALFPKEKRLDIECHDFERLQGLGYNEVGMSNDVFTQYDNAKKQATQLLTLVDSINSEDKRLAPKMERYLTSAALVVFISGGSIRDVFNVLQNHNARHSFLSKVPQAQYDNLNEYIDSLYELDEYDKKGEAVIGTKLANVVGIIDRLAKLKRNTYMELMLKKDTDGNIDLVDELQKNQLITIRMPESMFSTDNERDIYTTYWITKLWLALQIRKDKFNGRRHEMTKVNLVIDELYQVENTEIFLANKLNRLAKFGLKPIISCHHLKQIKYITSELRSANASYMLISGCDKKNFDELKDELYPFTVEDLLNLPRYHSLNLIKNKTGYGRFITKLPPSVSDYSNAIKEAAVTVESAETRGK